MRVVIQRVSRASVSINQQIRSSIGRGVLILLGIEDSDNSEDINWLVKKISQLRIFDDQDGVMNESLLDVAGDALVVSQFTLHANTKKGNRPSYIRASKPDVAIPMYERFVDALSATLKKEVKTGEFGATMQVDLLNDGPVTIIIDSRNKTF
nr:D-tyrosyl-tRNA(Tyr) deacylase [Sunxiuqinia sp.]